MKDESPKSISNLIKHIKLQFIILVVLIVFNVGHLLNYFWSFQELLDNMSILFNNNGVFLVAVVSFWENIFAANTYFPFSIVILSAMGLTHGMPERAVETFLAIYLSSVLAHIVNYWLGRIFKTKDEKPFKQNLWLIFWGTMWHPQFASVTSIECGTKKMEFRKFLSYYLPSSFTWYLFYGFLMYYLGSLKNSGTLFQYIFICYVVIWTALGVIDFYRKNKKPSVN